MGQFRCRKEQTIGVDIVEVYCSAAIGERDDGQHGKTVIALSTKSAGTGFERAGYRVLRFFARS
jgi:hypothetical protein